jgi:hypothetical protein
MSITSIENAKQLRIEGRRLGRDGLSQRINQLVLAFAKEYPDGHYREGIMLAGRLHAIFLATDPNDYWREVAERGFDREKYDLHNFEKESPITPPGKE